MTHLTFTQNTKATQEQNNRIKEIFSPDYVIESSKVISIMKEQDSVLSIRDAQIKELNDKILILQKEHKKTLVDIIKDVKVAENASKEVDEIADEILEEEKMKWKGLHLYVGIEVPKIEFNNLIFNTEFMYELEKIEFGIKGQVEPVFVNETSKYEFNYYLKVRYKFF